MKKIKKSIRTRSGFEKQVLRDLDKRKVSYEYEQEKLWYSKPVRKSYYLPDILFPSNGVYVECKGNFTSKDRTKLLLVREQNPGIDLRILFQKDNWLTKKHLKRYSDWARDNNFVFHVGSAIPTEWITGRTKK